MARAEKTRNGGQWTESRFYSFIKGGLRAVSTKWGPMHQCIRDAKVEYGRYKCDGCGAVGPPTLPPPEGKTRRVKNIIADHIDPVIDPAKGFESWDILIQRLFVEREGYQALCHKCHTAKTNEERDIATDRKQRAV